MTRQTKNLIVLLAGSFVGLMVLGMIVGFIAGYWSDVRDDRTDTALLWIVGGFGVVAMGLSMMVSIKWMQSIDEAAREAHKAAWFWGGTSGMALGMVFVILSSLPQAARFTPPVTWLEGRTDPAAYMATGAMAMLLLMTAGYTIVWMWWWWKRR